MTRLGPEVFDLPVAEIRRGYRSACYFWRAKKILEAERPDKRVVMQVFQKNNAVLCGIDEALAVLRVGTGYWRDQEQANKLFDEYLKFKLDLRATRFENLDHRLHKYHDLAILEDALDELWVDGWKELNVTALHDGDDIEPWESILRIEGPLHLFAHLESVYLGVLARRTKVATNVRRVCDAARGKPLLFFADRFDHEAMQGGDGYSAKIGGAQGVASDAMAAWWGERGVGTMPHALIAAYDGFTVDALQAFHKHYPEINQIALVDFNNSCVDDAVACARALGQDLWGVRLDTSENMVDYSLLHDNGSYPMGDYKPTGVNPALVHMVREELDDRGFDWVKIIVSGGFNVEKITAFEQARVPVDVYAVGSSLLQGSYDFTGDIVQPIAKRGRRDRDNPRLKVVV